MIDVAILRAAGLTDSQIVRVAEEYEKVQRELAAAKREKDRIRKRNERARPKNPVDAKDAVDSADPSALPSSPPHPPNNYPTNHDASLRSASQPDDKAVLFAEGQVILLRFGIPKERSGALIGGWLKRSDAMTVLKAIEQARDFAVSNPTAYIATILSKRASNGKQSLSELAHDMAEEVRQREREEDTRRTGTDERSGRDR